MTRLTLILALSILSITLVNGTNVSKMLQQYNSRCICNGSPCHNLDEKKQKICLKMRARLEAVIPEQCGEWGSYSDCSAECGGGEQTRVRTCSHVLKDDDWEEEDTQECNTDECPDTNTDSDCDNREDLGCWKDAGNRAIAGGVRLNSNNPIEDCQAYAKENGWTVFAVQYNTECFTAADAGKTYQKYGQSDACYGSGRGGTWAQNVYKISCRNPNSETTDSDTTDSDTTDGDTTDSDITGGDITDSDITDSDTTDGDTTDNDITDGDTTDSDITDSDTTDGDTTDSDITGGDITDTDITDTDTNSNTNECEVGREHLGCWKDTGNRAIAGGIRFNSNNPIEDCQVFAKEKGWTVFAVQYNTECLTAADAGKTFQKYGQSRGCNGGRGGTWAQDVYKVTETYKTKAMQTEKDISLH